MNEEFENRDRNYQIVVQELKFEIDEKIQEYATHKVEYENTVAKQEAEFNVSDIF